MSRLKALREQKNLTQEELSEKSGISARTIQRIETGKEPKGFTLRALAKALEIGEDKLRTNKIDYAEPDLNDTEQKDLIPVEIDIINYSYLKLINLSSIPFIILPPLNIVVPLVLMLALKQRNSLIKQLISVQIIWTIIAPILFILGVFLKLGNQFTIYFLAFIAIANVYIILRNTLEIDKNKRLYYRLNFNII
jgi:transcriptional regulator with XRE-family HTH domain